VNSRLAQVAHLAEECYAYIVAIETLQYACHMLDFAPIENALARKLKILSSMAPLTLVVYGCGSVEATTAYQGLQKLVPATGHLDECAVKVLAGMESSHACALDRYVQICILGHVLTCWQAHG
jgi:hypothetical protein